MRNIKSILALFMLCAWLACLGLSSCTDDPGPADASADASVVEAGPVVDADAPKDTRSDQADANSYEAGSADASADAEIAGDTGAADAEGA